MYSDFVKEHFTNPRNVGSMEDADGIGVAGDPGCGDMVRISVKIVGNCIDDIKFQTFGCGAAIATSSMLTEMVKGKTIEEARKVSGEDIAEALGGLPEGKTYCSNMAADALKSAVENYRGEADVE